MSVSWIELEGAVNVRDVGGLPTIDGRTTRPGVLLRADNLQDLTETDVTVLRERLRLQTVVDLRSTGEVDLAGEGPLKRAGLVHHHLSLIPEWDGEPDEAEVQRALDASVADKALPALPARPRQTDPTDLGDHYTGYVRDAGANIGKALHVLAEADSGAVLVHCAAAVSYTHLTLPTKRIV